MADAKTDLLQSSVFEGTTPQERDHLLELLQVEDYPQGEIIIREGNETQILWFLLQGQCEVIKTGKGGEQRQFAVLDPGAMFGEMSFVSPAPHSASIRSLCEVEVARLSRDDYDRLLEVCPSSAQKIAFKILHVLAGRLRCMDDWTCTLVDGNKDESEQHRQEWHDFRTKLYTEWEF
jgi:CRP-like cAMP-binding protein